MLVQGETAQQADCMKQHKKQLGNLRAVRRSVQVMRAKICFWYGESSLSWDVHRLQVSGTYLPSYLQLAEEAALVEAEVALADGVIANLR